MKINYENYVKNNRKLSDMTEEEKNIIGEQIKAEMQKRDLYGHVDITYYSDSALVKLDGEYYNMWNYTSGFFSGCVGDYKADEK